MGDSSHALTASQKHHPDHLDTSVKHDKLDQASLSPSVGGAAAPPFNEVSSSVPKSDDSDDEEGNGILEESPCGRWQKRREQVKQRDVPGVDVAYLAMDTEEGVEVVWNEVQFSERKNFREQEEKIKTVFDNLMHLAHVNLVKFHKWWADSKSEKPRVIFITEYMGAGFMSQFLKRSRQTNKNLSEKAWRKWCTQILSALSYLHSCDPPIVHGNLTCNTIFIQHTGLIKIGCVAPEAIHHHVKTCRDNLRNVHYIAPDYESGANLTPAVDIYAFGICALEMAALGFQTNGESSASLGVSPELIRKTIMSLDDPMQRSFIESCLVRDPEKRPKARELLFHAALFEVHSLKLLAAHSIVHSKNFDMISDYASRVKDEDSDHVIGEIVHADGRPGRTFKVSEVPLLEIDKFLEDVRNGVYPLTAFANPVHRSTTIMSALGGAAATRASSPAEQTQTEPMQDAQADDALESLSESRRVVQMSAEVKGSTESSSAASTMQLMVLLRMDDRMNRQLTCDVYDSDSPVLLATELVFHGFIHHEDCTKIATLVEDALRKFHAGTSAHTLNHEDRLTTAASHHHSHHAAVSHA